jgi:peroxiredoxin Q/BCP
VQVIGASVDSPRANESFATKYDLRFPLLCDPSRTLILAFGVDKPDKPSARRTTFMIEPDGTVRRVFENVSAAGHAAVVLAAARELWGG